LQNFKSNYVQKYLRKIRENNEILATFTDMELIELALCNLYIEAKTLHVGGRVNVRV
jgi:hypothetical protein